MGRMYSVQTGEQTVSAVQDLIELIGAADKVCLIHKVVVTQTASVASEQRPVRIVRRTTTGSGGSAVTPTKLMSGDAAASFTANRNVTSVGTISDILFFEGQNEGNGWVFHPTPEERPVFAGTAQRIGINISTAPSTGITVVAYALIEELG